MARKKISDVERFFQSIVKNENGCWEWQKFRDWDGYGLFRIGSRSDATRRSAKAHRWAYEHFKGMIPSGLCIDHICCNPGCANPDHLQTVTHLRNTQLGWERGTHVAHRTPHSEGTKEKIRKKALGRKHGLETRKKMSLARMGNKNSLGVKHSEMIKQKHRENAFIRIRNKSGQFT